MQSQNLHAATALCLPGPQGILHRDDRGIEALLKDTPRLAAVIELKHVPDYSTLQKAAKRLLRGETSARLLEATVRLGKLIGKLPTTVALAAMDGTSLESHHASDYLLRQRAVGRILAGVGP